MKNKAMSELMNAERILSSWKFLPGMQVKFFITHLIKALDCVSAYALGDASSIIERDYLMLSAVRLFDDVNVESAFYDNYFFMKNLLLKDIQRINEAVVRVAGPKQVFNADRDYFQSLFDNTKIIVETAFE